MNPPQIQVNLAAEKSWNTTNWEAVIGLEIHAQLQTRTKLFCRCSTQFGAQANTNVCPVCLGYPGALPVLNKEAVMMAARVGLAVAGTVNPLSYFERKNYFYPDLPKAYQISQLKQPIVTGGKVTLALADAHGNPVGTHDVRIERIQLEEDAGKLIHSQEQGVDASYVDLNRTSIPLIEIVSQPDMRTPEQATAYMRTLRTILLYLGVCDGNMQEGSLRCDANVSIRPRGSSILGTRAEIKNMNTFRGIEAALYYEIKRQIALVEAGKTVEQQTLLYDSVRKRTRAMRSKEEARDYRYFPDPDLLPVIMTAATVTKLTQSLPELPAAKHKRFMMTYQLSFYDSYLLVEDQDLAHYYETALQAASSLASTSAQEQLAKQTANWILTEVLSILNETLQPIATFPVSAQHVGELMGLIAKGTLSGKLAKEVFKEMLKHQRPPQAIIAEKNYTLVSDEATLTPIIEQVLSQHRAAAEEYKKGKKQSFGFLVGQVMRLTKGQADPKLVNTLLQRHLTTP